MNRRDFTNEQIIASMERSRADAFEATVLFWEEFCYGDWPKNTPQIRYWETSQPTEESCVTG